ncbi:MAG TPA: rod-binding protein [Spirochaetota bacterium]|nr:rod-binding protein [Spirochaetota bacterium]
MNGIESVVNNAVSGRIKSAENSLNKMNTNDTFETELKSAVKQTDPMKMDKTHKKLWDTCIEAESLFVGKMLKEMKKTVPKNEWLHGGQAEDIFEDMLYDEYSLKMSKNYNFGMAKLLYDEMSRRI